MHACKNDITKALKEAEKLMSPEGVTGGGQGKNKGQNCTRVFTSAPVESITPPLPKQIQRFDGIAEFTGFIQAF